MELQARMGRAYRDGKGVPRNLNKAAGWMRKAADLELGWAKWELSDILWMINTAESRTEMITMAEPLAESGNREMQARMGRAYRDGRGEEQDLDKAAYWMRKAYVQRLWYASWELFDILYSIGTSEALDEAIGIAVPLAESGSRELQARLGRAYRDGKGMEKDLDKAKEWYGKAVAQGLGWAKKELEAIDKDRPPSDRHPSLAMDDACSVCSTSAIPRSAGGPEPQRRSGSPFRPVGCLPGRCHRSLDGVWSIVCSPGFLIIHAEQTLISNNL